MSIKLFDLSGKTALVTGSSRGLGFAMAKGLAEAGARVVLNGINPAALDAAEAGLRAAGLDVRQARFDVADEAAVLAAFRGFDAAGLRSTFWSTTPASSIASRSSRWQPKIGAGSSRRT